MATKKSELQPEVSIGLVGHVDHGKTTLTERFSGKWTDTHSEELKRGITIRLGYADATFYSDGKEYSADPKSGLAPLRKVSFVDAPGHESLMATMLSGAAIMDGALLLIAANEECPQPQTKEHLMALEIVGIKNVVIVQNKIDLVKEEEAIENYKQIKEFVKGTAYENAPIIPVSARHGVNIGLLIEAIEKNIPTPERDQTKDPLMLVARSFDVNKPGSSPEKLVGGVLGGAMFQGRLEVGKDISLRPGRQVEKHGQKTFEPITTKIVSINTGGVDVKEATPGGSIGVMTTLDPAVAKSDSLTGNIVGYKGKLPPTWISLKLGTKLLDRVVGSKKDIVVDTIKMKETLMLNVNSAATVGVVNNLQKDEFTCTLKLPVCAALGSRVTISRRVGARWRLIGYGIIKE
ncbi:MAG: translation initiation factor IF-2 subunit gamma [Candidatus Nanoarchaeia archaeon]